MKKAILGLCGLSMMLTACATTKELLPTVISPPDHNTPLAQVLKLHPELKKDLATVEIRQYFNSVESPTAAEVKVTQTGLLDDSVKSIRQVYNYKLVDTKWTLVNKKEEYQCARGANKNFQTQKCS